MNETSLSRRGAFAKVFAGLAAFAAFRHGPKATPCAAAEHSFQPDIRTTAYTYDEQARLLSVTTYEGRRATTIAA